MEKYDIVRVLGTGTFAVAYLAKNRDTGETVTIKKMKKAYESWEECLKLREVRILQKIGGHHNIRKLIEVIRVKNELFLIFEYMEGSLLELVN